MFSSHVMFYQHLCVHKHKYYKKCPKNQAQNLARGNCLGNCNESPMKLRNFLVSWIVHLHIIFIAKNDNDSEVPSTHHIDEGKETTLRLFI